MSQKTAATGQGLAIKAFFKDIAATLSLKQGWSEKSLISKAYTAALCTFFIALFPLSYEHYTIVRCIICACVVIFYRECLTERSRNLRWLYVLIGIGLLYKARVWKSAPLVVGEYESI